jgi:hypothetical protein
MLDLGRWCLPLLFALTACSSDIAIGEGSGSSTEGSGGTSATGSSDTGGGGSLPSSSAETSSSATGGGGGAGAGGSSSTGPDPVVCDANSPCTDCVAVSCPEAWCGCTNEPDCAALFACFGECNGEEACNQQCLQTFPNGISSVLLVSDCATNRCPSDCPMGSTMLTPCEQCLYADCSAEMNACLSTPDCLGLLQCLQGCSDGQLTCQQQCYADHPGGAMPLELVIGCSQSECPVDCPG